MTYKPLTTIADLPKVGTLPEHLRLDVKYVVPNLVRRGKLEDLACDLAAFANSRGGTILVGAHEHPIGTLHAFTLMNKAAADRAGIAYGKTARELCSPQPVVDVHQIEVEKRKYAVAINVDAYAAPPIGVRMKAQNGSRPRWWAFPARRGTDNVPLRPEELATIMDPRLRRTILRFQRLADAAHPHEARLRLQGTQGGYGMFSLRLIEPDAGTLLLEGQPPAKFLFVVPLDLVGAVWTDSTGVHHVSVNGRIDGTPQGTWSLRGY